MTDVIIVIVPEVNSFLDDLNILDFSKYVFKILIENLSLEDHACQNIFADSLINFIFFGVFLESFPLELKISVDQIVLSRFDLLFDLNGFILGNKRVHLVPLLLP